MDAERREDPQRVLERMERALNARDLDAYVACFAPDYRSEQPIHPDWTYVGCDQLRWNWTAVFENVRDFTAELLRSTIDGNTFWSEWRWTGFQSDGSPMTVVGTIIMGVRDDKIAWGRIYMESEVRPGPGDMDVVA